MAADQVASALALGQQGIFSRDQLLERGVPASTIDLRVREGRWLRHTVGIFQLDGTPITLRSSAKAASMALPGSAASHTTAAQLHEIAPLPPRLDPRVHLTTMGSSRRRTKAVVTHRVLHLDPEDVVDVDGIPTTGRARTLIDLAAELRIERYRTVFDRQVASGRLLPELIAAFDRVPKRGRRGIALVSQLLEHRLETTTIATSELERRFLALLDDHGLPEPVCQFLPPWAEGVGFGRADFGYPIAKLLIEADGRAFHTTVEAFEADRPRDQRAVEAGWRPLRFTWDQIVDKPAEVAATISRALGCQPSPLC